MFTRPCGKHRLCHDVICGCKLLKHLNNNSRNVMNSHVVEVSDVVVVEGTGHCAVGSIVGMNNAKVASLIGADMVLIANGGLGKQHVHCIMVGAFLSLNSHYLRC